MSCSEVDEEPESHISADEDSDADDTHRRSKSSGSSSVEVDWMTAVKDWAGVMISAQTLIGRILVSYICEENGREVGVLTRKIVNRASRG